jgi:glycosyltransferase involved in cell wall biosynthesis
VSSARSLVDREWAEIDGATRRVEIVAFGGIETSGLSILASRWLRALEQTGVRGRLTLPNGARHPDEVGAQIGDPLAAVEEWSRHAAGIDPLLVAGLPLERTDCRLMLCALESRAEQAVVLWEHPLVGVLEVTDFVGRSAVPLRLGIGTLNPHFIPRLEEQLPGSTIAHVPLVLPQEAMRPSPSPPRRGAYAIAVGRFNRRKGMWRLCERWAEEIGPELKVSLIALGSGHGAEDSLEREIEELALESPWLDHMHVGPFEDRFALIQSATCAVFPAIDDHLPQALVETMIARTPVVVTPIDAHLAVVQHGVTGFVLADTDLSDLLQAVRHLLEEGGTASRIARSAERVVRERFSPAAVGVSLAQLLLAT